MNSFFYYNPVKIIFGEGSLNKLPQYIDPSLKILLMYGKNSIKENGTYDKVISLLSNNTIIEFSGITANPTYTLCKCAAQKAQENNIDFILAVGGGSVIDAAKYTAALSQSKYAGNEWELFKQNSNVAAALPLGVILTLPGTSTEMNLNAVISNEITKEKYTFRSPVYYPKFSIIDPEVMKSIPVAQLASSVVDSFSHVLEQYLTYPVDAWVQDKFSESILSILYSIGTSHFKNMYDSNILSNFVWASTQALSGILGCGVPQDWSSHVIAHAITASFGIEHADAVAIVLPGVLEFQKDKKRKKLLQLLETVFSSKGLEVDSVMLIEEFFIKLGKKIRLSEYNLNRASISKILNNVIIFNEGIGENKDLTIQEIEQILLSRL